MSIMKLLMKAVFVWWNQLFCKHEYELEMTVSGGVGEGFGNTDFHFVCTKCRKRFIVETVGKQVAICHDVNKQGEKRCLRNVCE